MAADPDVEAREAEARVGARITPEEIEKERARIGYTVGYTYQWNVEASIDSIRHFANGCGDDNPMWCDEAYAGATRWGGVVASPLFYMTMGDDRSPKAPPELKEKARGALSGVHLFHAGTEVEWGGHIRPGDRLDFVGIVSDVDVKEQSAFAGTSVVTHHELEWTNQRGEPVVWQHEWYVRTERKTAAKRGKLKKYEEARYTDEDLARIDEAYRAREAAWCRPALVGGRARR